jgi:hypothetical protein
LIDCNKTAVFRGRGAQKRHAAFGAVPMTISSTEKAAKECHLHRDRSG